MQMAKMWEGWWEEEEGWGEGRGWEGMIVMRMWIWRGRRGWMRMKTGWR